MMTAERITPPLSSLLFSSEFRSAGTIVTSPDSVMFVCQATVITPETQLSSATDEGEGLTQSRISDKKVLKCSYDRYMPHNRGCSRLSPIC